jgi:AcrR family transcriptional regulator
MGSAVPARGELPGLRERARARRRAAIQETALRMFAERGYDATTIADIAHEAEVAPRTVSMYFPSKLDLALSPSSDAAARLAAAFAAGDPGAGFLAVIDSWLGEEERAVDPRLRTLAEAAYEANPALRALGTARLTAAVQAGPPARADLPPGHAAILAAALGATIAEYLATLARGGAPAHRFVMRFLRGTVNAAGTRRPAAPR